jgi:hypothetical protein
MLRGACTGGGWRGGGRRTAQGSYCSSRSTEAPAQASSRLPRTHARTHAPRARRRTSSPASPDDFCAAETGTGTVATAAISHLYCGGDPSSPTSPRNASPTSCSSAATRDRCASCDRPTDIIIGSQWVQTPRHGDPINPPRMTDRPTDRSRWSQHAQRFHAGEGGITYQASSSHHRESMQWQWSSPRGV